MNQAPPKCKGKHVVFEEDGKIYTHTLEVDLKSPNSLLVEAN